MKIAIVSENIIYRFALEGLISELGNKFKFKSYSSITKLENDSSDAYEPDCLILSQQEFFSNVCLLCKYVNSADQNRLRRVIVFGSKVNKLNIEPSISRLDIDGPVNNIKLKLSYLLRTIPAAICHKITSPLPALSRINAEVIARIYKGENMKKIAYIHNLSPKTISGMNIRMLKQIGLNKTNFKKYFKEIPPCLFRKEYNSLHNDFVSIAVYRMVWKCVEKGNRLKNV